jgi:hypothetical protein
LHSEPSFLFPAFITFSRIWSIFQRPFLQAIQERVPVSSMQRSKNLRLCDWPS